MFITLEGIDGCGKSTQARLLYEGLSQYGNVVLTKEPGGWPGGEVLRDIVINGKLAHPLSEVYLFMLDRAEHVARVILPALSQGIVICERYNDSTLAYQSWGRGVPLADIMSIYSTAKFPVPDISVLLDIEPEIALSRVAKRGNMDSFEQEGLEFMRRVRGGYRYLAKLDPKRWIVIDAGRDPNIVSAELLERITKNGSLKKSGQD